jgi:hypothetical protein
MERGGGVCAQKKKSGAIVVGVLVVSLCDKVLVETPFFLRKGKRRV